ncbi:MAG: hypothetical protein ABIF09_19340 [Gemmatimonadota bacterium]
MNIRVVFSLPALAAVLLLLPACGEKSGSVPDVPAAELVAEVPELDAVHETMEPLWHEAFPAQDYEAIAAATPQFEATLSALLEAQLPGILQDKQARWDEQKQLLMDSYAGLKAAVDAGNQAEMLAYTEAFHMNYEGMVRIVRPVLPELEAFHQHLYGLYHYYGPGYDLEKIRSASTDMAAAIPPLQAAELPSNLASHQAHFEMVVTQLGEAVGALIATLDSPSRTDVEAAIDAVHAAYEEVEGIFDTSSHG